MRGLTLLRVALVAFVIVWLFGPYALRSAVPAWLVFLIALGLELNFFLGALRPAPRRIPDRAPQPVDQERYGYYDWTWEDDDYVDVEPEDRGLPVRQFLVGLGVIAALILLVWIVDRGTGWDALDADTQAEAEMRFSDEASRLAGKPVAIRCDDSGSYVGAVQHADGVALVGGDLAYLTPERCIDLYRLAFKDEVRGSQTGRAIAVLAHETWHLRGVKATRGRPSALRCRAGSSSGSSSGSRRAPRAG